jgi:hypothetical protein
MPRLCVALVVGLAATAQAQGYERTRAEGADPPTCVWWESRRYEYRVDAAADDATASAIDAAFASWQAVADGCADFTFVQGPRVAAPQVGVGTADDNVVTFRRRACRDVVPAGDGCLATNACANAYACWDHSALTLALTTATYARRTGVISDADVELNAAPKPSGGCFVFTTVSAPPCDAVHRRVMRRRRAWAASHTTCRTR